MTGYGKCELNLSNSNFTVEIKSLNSKQIDTNIKMSSVYWDKEIGLRKLVSENLKRGKIEISIWRENSDSSPKFTLNKEIIKRYHEQIDEIRKELGYSPAFLNENGIFIDIMQTMVHMPDIMIRGEEKLDQNEWLEIEKGVKIAIDNLLQFRLDEGKKLEEEIMQRVNKLSDLLLELAPFAKARIEKIKNNLTDKLSDLEFKIREYFMK